MKIKTKILIPFTPLKEYVSEWSEDVTKEEIEEVKKYMSNISDLNYLQIKNGDETYFSQKKFYKNQLLL